MLQVLKRAAGVGFFLAASSLYLAAATPEPPELRVFATVTLTEVMTEIARNYNNTSKQKVRLNFAASALLASQLRMGVPVDLIFLADTPQMDALEKEGWIQSESRQNVAATTIVMSVNRESPLVIHGPEDLLSPKVGRIAVGDPDLSASGASMKKYLETRGIWQQLGSRLVLTANGRATLMAVEDDKVGVGLLYKVDVLISRRAKVAYEIPTQDLAPVAFPLALPKRCKNVTGAQAFKQYILSHDGIAVLKRYGFTPVASAVGGTSPLSK